jgi:hypothetical protein
VLLGCCRPKILGVEVHCTLERAQYMPNALINPVSSDSSSGGTGCGGDALSE